MNILYYDCFSGISGDMNLGALIDVGVDAGYLEKELKKLHLDADYALEVKKSKKNGITGTKFTVQVRETGKESHAHRNLNDIKKIICQSSLAETVKEESIRMFSMLAGAEAEVHGVPVEEVYFHEVGAVDSIIDIVGAAIALAYLHVDRILCSSVQVGSGFVKCEHGLLPVPAPAVAALLTGIPIRTGGADFECTTPTGALILAANVNEFADASEFTIKKTGYGIGSRDAILPNVLRIHLCEAFELFQEREMQTMIETNIDDMNPEFYGYVEELLFEAGAKDVYKTPIIMKKGRPGVKLSVLVDQQRENDVCGVIFRETTSIGMRKYSVHKAMLEREMILAQTIYGDVPVKRCYFEGAPVKYKAEFETAKKIARKAGVLIADVYREVDRWMDKNRTEGK